MVKFLVDADLPLSLYQRLRGLGYTADDVRPLGLGQAQDQQIFDYAVQQGYCLVSSDKGFANLLRFPLGSHHGIVVARFPRNCPGPTTVGIVTKWLPTLTPRDITGNLVIIEAHGVRIRRPQPPKRRKKP
jgi:predicted nuclease of predicted toxin-antitoxin system